MLSNHHPADESVFEDLKKNSGVPFEYLENIQNNYTMLNINETHYIESETSTEIIGQAGTGKTQLCIHLVYKVILPQRFGGLDSSALFISTDKPVPFDRMDQFFNKYKSDLSNEEIMDLQRKFKSQRIQSKEELLNTMKTLDNYIGENGIKAIIIDSVAPLMVGGFEENGEVNYALRKKYLEDLMATLNELALKYSLFVVLTNNVVMMTDEERASIYQSEDLGENFKPCFGMEFENNFNTVFLIRKGPANADPSRRLLTSVVNEREYPYNVRFYIQADGLLFEENDLEGPDE